MQLPITPVINPYDAADASAMVDALARLRGVDDLLARGTEVGFSLDDLSQQAGTQRSVLQGLQKLFFPASHNPYGSPDSDGSE